MLPAPLVERLAVSELLTLDVPEGVNAHLMWRESNPPRRQTTIEQVGYWIATNESGEIGHTEWFDVNGDVAQAQAVLDNEAAPHLLEAVSALLAAPEPEPEPDRRLLALEKARAALAAKRAAAKAEAPESKRGRSAAAPAE